MKSPTHTEIQNIINFQNKQEMKRVHIDDIALGDKFTRDGITYSVRAFHGTTYVLAEGPKEDLDHYTFRDDKLLGDINEYYKNQK